MQILGEAEDNIKKTYLSNIETELKLLVSELNDISINEAIPQDTIEELDNLYKNIVSNFLRAYGTLVKETDRLEDLNNKLIQLFDNNGLGQQQEEMREIYKTIIKLNSAIYQLSQQKDERTNVVVRGLGFAASLIPNLVLLGLSAASNTPFTPLGPRLGKSDNNDEQTRENLINAATTAAEEASEKVIGIIESSIGYGTQNFMPSSFFDPLPLRTMNSNYGSFNYNNIGGLSNHSMFNSYSNMPSYNYDEDPAYMPPTNIYASSSKLNNLAETEPDLFANFKQKIVADNGFYFEEAGNPDKLTIQAVTGSQLSATVEKLATSTPEKLDVKIVLNDFTNQESILSNLAASTAGYVSTFTIGSPNCDDARIAAEGIRAQFPTAEIVFNNSAGMKPADIERLKTEFEVKTSPSSSPPKPT